jgi:hypothetical protein
VRSGVPLLTGREFTDADDARSAKVAVVNETFARHFGLGANPVGSAWLRARRTRCRWTSRSWASCAI